MAIGRERMKKKRMRLSGFFSSWCPFFSSSRTPSPSLSLPRSLTRPLHLSTHFTGTQQSRQMPRGAADDGQVGVRGHPAHGRSRRIWRNRCVCIRVKMIESWAIQRLDSLESDCWLGLNFSSGNVWNKRRGRIFTSSMARESCLLGFDDRIFP